MAIGPITRPTGKKMNIETSAAKASTAAACRSRRREVSRACSEMPPRPLIPVALRSHSLRALRAGAVNGGHRGGPSELFGLYDGKVREVPRVALQCRRLTFDAA